MQVFDFPKTIDAFKFYYTIMKKIVVLLLTVLLFSCSLQESLNPIIEPIPELAMLQERFPNHFENVDLESYRKTLAPLVGEGGQQYSEILADSYEIKNNDHVYGYFYNSSSFTTLVLFNQEWNELSVFNLKNDSSLDFERIVAGTGVIQLFDKTNNVLLENSINPIIFASGGCGYRLMLCAAGCTLASIAIAASDGPLPFMDALAVSFYIVCNGECAIDSANCEEI